MNFRWSAGCAIAVLLVGCHSGDVRRAISPVIGTWHIAGDTPQPDAALPRFTTLEFRRNGKLEATYVAAGGALAGIVHSSPKLASEHDTFTIEGNRRLRIVEGSRALDYAYEIRDNELFLTAPGEQTATVYKHADDTDPTPTDSPADAQE